MAQKNKESIYWILVGLYGGILLIALLYLRFPVEKFRQYCEYLVEKTLPGVNCDIARVSYDFPLGLHFMKMQIRDADDALLLEDSRFSMAPAWGSLTNTYAVESQAFGGSHSALLSVNDGEDGIAFNELQIDNLAIEKIPAFAAMDRPITGILSGNGTALLSRRELRTTRIEGKFLLADGSYELSRPLFLMSNIELPQTTFRLFFSEGVAQLSEGKLRTPKVDGDFQGSFTIAESLVASRLNVTGNLTPKAPLFPDSKQLQAVVSGVQRRYRSEELPFKLGGTLGRPSFIFSK
ncbi:MAG: type II secretion system protein GspN [Desulfocapsaceae bacterium]|nr:type II secretion system protein GspN [Desulfocapsaceae bacterium]